MGERKFVIKNSKCFTYMTAHIHMQLLKLMGKLPRSLAQHPTLVGAGSTLTSGTYSLADQSEVLVQVRAQNATIPVILNHVFINI